LNDECLAANDVGQHAALIDFDFATGHNVFDDDVPLSVGPLGDHAVVFRANAAIQFQKTH
jgi:hypothetical protein